MQPSNESIKVTVGPIIGKVTHNTARVLVEFTKSEQVVCYLQSPSGEVKTCYSTSKANVPIVFSFDNLKPKTQYRVTLSCPLSRGESSFWTLRENNDNPGSLKTGLVSCNEIVRQYMKPKDKDLWAHLGGLVRSHALDYVFHIGDQVYMDVAGDDKTKHIYGKCHKILSETSKKKWKSKVPELLELLRQEYRRTWTYPSVAFVLANVPNLMICDDHEFRDDWGFRAEDSKPGTIDNFYGELARQVYYEYQRQLREDIPWDNLKSLKNEYHYHILNGVGVSFMEYRGCRSWFQEEKLKETLTGKAQKEWIFSLFKKGGKLDQVDSTIFVTPVPFFLLSHFLSELAYLKSNDLQEHYTYHNVPQLIELLDLLREWKERRQGREILIAAGDAHLGGWTDVWYKKKKIFSQFVSSAINSAEATKVEKAILDVLMKVGRLNKDYSFFHYEWKRENNFGLIETSQVNKVSKIQSTLVIYPEGKK